MRLLVLLVPCRGLTVALKENYFSLHRRPSEIILSQRVENCLTLFQNYFMGLLQLMNIF